MGHVTAATYWLGLCGADVTVAMPGGELRIGIGAGFAMTHAGPVASIASGTLAGEFLSA